MAVQYDKEKGFTTWLDSFKDKIPDVSKEVNVLFDDINKGITNINDISSDDINKIFDRYKITEWREDLENFLKSWDGVGDISSSYQSWMIQNGKATSTFTTFTAKAGTVLKSFGATLASIGISWAISEIISFAIKSFDNLAHSAEHCKERVDSLMESYKSAMDTANAYAKTVENIADKYEELSKGVNNLGENVSLTTDEYTEYNKIVNQIAEMFPQMVQGYTDEGNAILSVKGNVEALRDAYKEAQQEAYNMLIITGKDSAGNDIIKNANNIINGTKAHYSNVERIDFMDELSEALDSTEQLTKLYEEAIDRGYRYVDWMSDAGIYNILDIKSLSDNDLDTIKKNIQVLKQTYQAEIDSAMKGVQTLANAYLMTNDDYAKMDDEAKKAASVITNSINESLYMKWDGNSNAIGTYVTGIVDTIKDNSDVQDALVSLFRLDADSMLPDLNNVIIDQYINTIAEKLDEDPLELKVRLGFEDFDTLARNYSQIMSQAVDKFSNNSNRIDVKYELESFAEQNSINTQDEIAFWRKCIEESNTREEAMQKYLDASVVEVGPQAFTFSTYEQQLDGIQSAITTLRSALESFNKGELSKIQVLDLMQQFPELTPYIDLAADGFGNLSEGLSALIEQQPDSLIQSLEQLKDSLSTDAEREQVKLLIDELQRLSSYGDSGIEAYATTIGSTWGDTANVIEGVTNQFENLAKVQEYVANGLTITATAAAELARMYPEILDHAQVTANGQITLNEEVVKNILDGDKSIIDAQITKLEADKAELTAKRDYAEAQLNIAKQVGEGEGKRYCPLPQ